MTFSAASTIANLDLGALLKILSEGAVYPQLPTASEIWNYMLRQKDGNAQGRQVNFEVLTGRGPAAVQFTSFNGDFPLPQRSEVVEGTLNWKDFDLTIDYDISLQNKTGSALISYARPLALEVESKGAQKARVLSAAALGDGSGVIGVVGSVTADATANTITVVLSVTDANADRSHPGWFDFTDQVKFATTAGTAHSTINNTGTTVGYWQVTDVSVEDSTVTLKPYTAAGVAIDITTATLGATDPTAADCIYRKGTTPNDLTAISTNDYNSICEVFAGLPSLMANDGRTVNGLTMSGVLAGTQRDVGGSLLSSKDFQKLLSLLKRRTSGMSDGKKLSYPKALMHDITYDTMVEQNEANRQWYNITDPSTGVSKIGHRHGKQYVEFESDEFIPFQRIYLLPDLKGPLVFKGEDMKTVNVGGTNQFLANASSGGGHSKRALTYMSGSGAFMTKHPAALGMIRDFSLTP